MNRTTLSRQGDTLDAICHRFFGQASMTYLPMIIAQNPHLNPVALLPYHSMVILPNENKPTRGMVKLWD